MLAETCSSPAQEGENREPKKGKLTEEHLKHVVLVPEVGLMKCNSVTEHFIKRFDVGLRRAEV